MIEMLNSNKRIEMNQVLNNISIFWQEKPIHKTNPTYSITTDLLGLYSWTRPSPANYKWWNEQKPVVVVEPGVVDDWPEVVVLGWPGVVGDWPGLDVVVSGRPVVGCGAPW